MNAVLSDFLWACAVLGFLGLSFFGVRALQTRAEIKPELSRKLVHMAMAVAVLPFPWIFANQATVGIIAGLATAGLLAVRMLAPKGERDIGGVLYRVGRLRSVGELVYPLAVAAAYYMAPSPELYLIPILVLGFADSMAALVGTEYAKRQLAAQRESPKSAEGAVAFFSAAFICVVSPLLLFSELNGRVIFLVALLSAFMAMLLELVCSFGLDNFFIPFFIAIFLRGITLYDTNRLWLSFGLMLCYLIVAIFFIRRQHVTILGVAQALLVLFLGTLLGGMHWAAAPVIMAFTYSAMPALLPEERARPLNYHDVETNFIPGLVIIVAGSLVGMPPLAFWIYSSYYACMTAKNHILRMYHYFPKDKRSVLLSCLRGVLWQLLPAAVMYRFIYAEFPGVMYVVWAVMAVLAEILISIWLARKNIFPIISIRLGWICSLSSLVLAAGMVILGRFINA